MIRPSSERRPRCCDNTSRRTLQFSATFAMTLTYIWSGFFLVGFAAALAQWLVLGDATIFKKIVDGTFESAKLAVMDIALPLAGVMTLWLGILNIGERAGAIALVSRWIAPFFSRIFPQVPKDHPASGHMVMNFSANSTNCAGPIFVGSGSSSSSSPAAIRIDTNTDKSLVGN